MQRHVGKLGVLIERGAQESHLGVTEKAVAVSDLKSVLWLAESSTLPWGTGHLPWLPVTKDPRGWTVGNLEETH